MRTKKRTPDFGAISKASIKRDFSSNRIYHDENKMPEIKKSTEINSEKRIAHISENSQYYKYARYILGKLVRVISKSQYGGNSYNCEFVFDDDRKVLNNIAGWSDKKKEYLFDGIKFK